MLVRQIRRLRFFFSLHFSHRLKSRRKSFFFLPAPCRLFARLVLLHSARLSVVLQRHWLLRSLATATTSVAPEVFAIFCLAIQFFWHQRHGVKGGATANVCRLVKSPFPPSSSSSVSFATTFRLPTHPPSSSAELSGCWKTQGLDSPPSFSSRPRSVCIVG